MANKKKKDDKNSHFICQIFKSNCVTNFLPNLDPHLFCHS